MDVDNRDKTLGIIIELMTPNIRYLNKSNTEPFAQWGALYAQECVDKKKIAQRYNALTFPPGSIIGAIISLPIVEDLCRIEEFLYHNFKSLNSLKITLSGRN